MGMHMRQSIYSNSAVMKYFIDPLGHIACLIACSKSVRNIEITKYKIQASTKYVHKLGHALEQVAWVGIQPVACFLQVMPHT